MRKALFALLLMGICSLSFAQMAFPKEAAASLDKALVAKDPIALKQLLHGDLTYGHSNGWVQTKADIIKDMASGKFVYEKINSKEAKWTLTNDVATVRSETDVAYQLDGKPGELHLHVLQVWLKTANGWQLLTRQSTKL